MRSNEPTCVQSAAGKVAHGQSSRIPPLRLARPMTRTAANGPRSGENRARLLQLSATLFATQGYAQVSVRDLAARLGVTTGALYSEFQKQRRPFG